MRASRRGIAAAAKEPAAATVLLLGDAQPGEWRIGARTPRKALVGPYKELRAALAAAAKEEAALGGTGLAHAA